MFRKHASRFYAALLSAAIVVGVMVGLLLWSTGAFPVRAATSSLQGGSYKMADVSEVPPGGTVAYTIVLSNSSGSDLDEVLVTDALDTRLTYQSHGVVGDVFQNVDHTPNHITFTLLQLKANSVVTLSLAATVTDTATSGDVIQNTATISDPVSIFATDPATFTVSRPPSIQIYDPDSGSYITDQPGDIVTVVGRAWTEFDPPPFPNPPVIAPIDNFGGGGDYIVDWSPVEGAYYYNLQESYGGTFENPTEYTLIMSPTTSQPVSVDSSGLYAYRVTAYNSEGRPSRWSNVQTVDVSDPNAWNLAARQEPNTSLNATVMVSVSTDGGVTWHAADTLAWNDDGWWDWTYDWALGPDRKDEIPTPLMARAFYAGGGGWNQDTITVTVSNAIFYSYFPIIFQRWPPIPYEPATLTASDPGNGDDYTVSWTYGNHPDAPITGFQLQEDDNSGFSSPETFNLDDSVNSKDFIDKPDGSYWYRLRGVNSYGYGSWTDPIQVVVETGYIYNFHTGGDTEGWAINRSDDHFEKPDTLPQPVSMNGSLYHLVWGKADFSIISPMEQAPDPPYTIKARVALVNDEDIPGDGNGPYDAKTGMTWAIIFGGNGGTPCPADRNSPNGCLNHYYRVMATYDQSAGRFNWELKRIDYHEGNEGGGKGRGVSLVDWNTIEFDYDALGWNEWEIRVTNEASNNIKVYMNGNHLASVTDHRYINDPFFGTFLASVKELGGVATKWDWFRVQR